MVTGVTHIYKVQSGWCVRAFGGSTDQIYSRISLTATQTALQSQFSCAVFKKISSLIPNVALSCVAYTLTFLSVFSECFRLCLVNDSCLCFCSCCFFRQILWFSVTWNNHSLCDSISFSLYCVTSVHWGLQYSFMHSSLKVPSQHLSPVEVWTLTGPLQICCAALDHCPVNDPVWSEL